MHELSIAQSIIATCEAEAAKHNSKSISKIVLRIGEFTGVVKEALDFAFDICKKDTLASNAQFEYEIVPLKTQCTQCKEVFTDVKDFNFHCKLCGEPVNLLEGRELEIKLIDIL